MEKSESDTFNKFVAELDNNFEELSQMVLVLGQDCHYAQRATHAKTQRAPEEIAVLDAKIQKLEATLKSMGS